MKEYAQNTGLVQELKNGEEKDFWQCFSEASIPIALLASRMMVQNTLRPAADFKEYLQSQNPPSIDELSRQSPSQWEDLFFDRKYDFSRKADRAIKPDQKAALGEAIKERRIMSGRKEAENTEQRSLPKYSITPSTCRDFRYQIFNGIKKPLVPNPKPIGYRLNIPDAPGELREVILNRLIKAFWRNPIFRKHGFAAKVIGSAKTDGLILYLADETVNAALEITLQDALEQGYGKGEPARFGQRIDPRITGITLTTDPRDEKGNSLGTFGEIISEILKEALARGMEQSKIRPEALVKLILDFNHYEWGSEYVEPFFNKIAREKFGERTNLKNLAFIDKGKT